MTWIDGDYAQAGRARINPSLHTASFRGKVRQHGLRSSGMNMSFDRNFVATETNAGLFEGGVIGRGSSDGYALENDLMKAILIVAAVAFAGLSTAAFANDDAYPNSPKDIPGSSTAATPSTVKTSPGTVGAMKDAGDGSFTASKASQAQEHLTGNSGK